MGDCGKLGTGRAWLMLSAPRLTACAAAALLGACSTLPVDGPTGAVVEREGRDAAGSVPFRVVEVSDAAVLPATPAPPPLEVLARPPPPTDLIGPGDVLNIAIYEAGVALFAGGHGSPTGEPAPASGGAQVATLPAQRVDDLGFIRIPYAGRLRAAGLTPEELDATIHDALRGMSQDPQVVVAIEQSIANSVIVGGELTRPGRLVLSTNRETLADTIALAGGYRGDAKDLVVRVARAGRDVEYRLSDVLSGVNRDMRVSPGDRIEVVSQPLTFSVLGASGKVAQSSFTQANMSLAEAVSLSGGANPSMGDAKAIFVFRFEPGSDGKPIPVVYHLNMMHAEAYFLSQRFAMRDKDVLYFGNAASNQPAKLIQLISQLFSPLATVSGVLINSNL